MIDERVALIEQRLKTVEGILLGPPAFEEKIKLYVDARDTHKDNNARQYIADMRGLLRDEKDYRDDQHTDNQSQFRLLFRLVYIGMGILIALQTLILLRK